MSPAMVRNESRLRLFRILAALVVFGCSSGAPPETDGGIRGPDIVINPAQVGTTADECAAYCQKQVGLCSGSLPASDCTTACIGVGQRYPTCERDWATLCRCKTLDQLICNAQGQPTTTHCLFYETSYGVCLQTTAADGG